MVSTRRMILLGGLGAAGALVVGYALWPSGRIGRINRLDARARERFVNNWIKIAQDGTITIVDSPLRHGNWNLHRAGANGGGRTRRRLE